MPSIWGSSYTKNALACRLGKYNSWMFIFYALHGVSKRSMLMLQLWFYLAPKCWISNWYQHQPLVDTTKYTHFNDIIMWHILKHVQIMVICWNFRLVVLKHGYLWHVFVVSKIGPMWRFLLKCQNNFKNWECWGLKTLLVHLGPRKWQYQGSSLSRYSSSSFINHANSCERAYELGRLT